MNNPLPTIFLAHPNTGYLNAFKNHWNNSSFSLIGVSKNGFTSLRTILRKKPDFAILYYALNKAETFDIIREVKNRGIKTQFCVLYDEEPTVKDFIIKKTLHIERCVNFNGTLKDLVDKTEAFLKSKKYTDAFSNIVVDNHVYKIKQLEKNKLELLCLLTAYEEVSIVLKKTNLDQESLTQEVSSICSVLEFKSSNQLMDWCQANMNIIVNLATQAA